MARPYIGEKTTLRIPPELRAKVDAFVEELGLAGFAEGVRMLVEMGLEHRDDYTFG